MKRFRIIFALVLVLALSLAFTVPAFAAGTGTGAQEDPYQGGNNYGFADDGSIYLHKLDIAAFEKSKAQELIAGGSLSAGGTVTYTGNVPLGTSVSGGEVVGYYTTSDDEVTQVDVTLGQLAALGNITFRIQQVQLSGGSAPGSTNPEDYEAVPAGVDGYAKTDGAGQIAWTGLPHSHYRITEQPNDTALPVGGGSYIVSLPMANPADTTQTINTVHIYPKNRAAGLPFIEKEKPSLSDHNGNILSWTIKTEIPAGLKAVQGNQSYVVSDAMSNGLAYSGNLKVYYLAGGTPVELISGADYSAPVNPGDTGFTVTLGSDGFAKLGGALPGGIDKEESGRYILYITYDTVVNMSEEEFENSITLENDVQLNLTNNDGTEYENNPGPVVVENYAGIKLIKKDGANANVLLPGAQFNVYTKLTAGNTAPDPASVLKNADGTAMLFTTDKNGEFFIGGLGAGNYYIVEIAPPANYKLLNGFTTVVITEAEVNVHTIKEATVLNYLDNGLTLPSTGGAGTLIFLVGGLLLIAAAGLVFFLSRKRGQTKKTVSLKQPIQ